MNKAQATDLMNALKLRARRKGLFMELAVGSRSSKVLLSLPPNGQASQIVASVESRREGHVVLNRFPDKESLAQRIEGVRHHWICSASAQLEEVIPKFQADVATSGYAYAMNWYGADLMRFDLLDRLEGALDAAWDERAEPKTMEDLASICRMLDARAEEFRVKILSARPWEPRGHGIFQRAKEIAEAQAWLQHAEACANLRSWIMNVAKELEQEQRDRYFGEYGEEGMAPE